MRPIPWLAWLMLSVLAAPMRGDEDKTPTITVVGHGSVTVAPDLAVFTVAVETDAGEAEAAVAENARKSEAVVSAIEEELHDDGTVSTTGYSLQPRYADTRTGASQPPIIGYVARNEVRIESTKLENVGALIDTAIAAGANRLGRLTFTLAERGPHLRAALAEAGKEARAQAESIAESLGVTLGSVLSATTEAPARPVPQRYGAAMAEARATTPVQPGELELSATLRVTYRIE